MPEDSLEGRAKKLLRYHLTKEGDVPKLLTPECQEALQYLFDNNYLTRKYEKTENGLNWLNS